MTVFKQLLLKVVYGKVYKVLELCYQHMRVHPMEIMNGLVPKGTGKITLTICR